MSVGDLLEEVALTITTNQVIVVRGADTEAIEHLQLTAERGFAGSEAGANSAEGEAPVHCARTGTRFPRPLGQPGPYNLAIEGELNTPDAFRPAGAVLSSGRLPMNMAS